MNRTTKSIKNGAFIFETERQGQTRRQANGAVRLCKGGTQEVLVRAGAGRSYRPRPAPVGAPVCRGEGSAAPPGPQPQALGASQAANTSRVAATGASVGWLS